jgi:hypothetical protein
VLENHSAGFSHYIPTIRRHFKKEGFPERSSREASGPGQKPGSRKAEKVSRDDSDRR